MAVRILVVEPEMTLADLYQRLVDGIAPKELAQIGRLPLAGFDCRIALPGKLTVRAFLQEMHDANLLLFQSDGILRYIPRM